MNITKQVKQLLTENPEMRDKPKKLLRKALQDAYGINILSAMIIAEHYKNVLTITRASRKIQQDHEELRGKEWAKRKGIKADIVKAKLGYK
jgi:hypothetical protein